MKSLKQWEINGDERRRKERRFDVLKRGAERYKSNQINLHSHPSTLRSVE